MAHTVSLHQFSDLAKADSKNEILISTQKNTELFIRVCDDGETVISLPFGNRFDIVDGRIIIHEKP